MVHISGRVALRSCTRDHSRLQHLSASHIPHTLGRCHVTRTVVCGQGDAQTIKVGEGFQLVLRGLIHKIAFCGVWSFLLLAVHLTCSPAPTHRPWIHPLAPSPLQWDPPKAKVVCVNTLPLSYGYLRDKQLGLSKKNIASCTLLCGSRSASSFQIDSVECNTRNQTPQTLQLHALKKLRRDGVRMTC